MIPPLELRVPSLWDLLRDVRARIGTHLQDADPDLRDATMMAASELVENAIKYGKSGPDAPESWMRLQERDGKLELKVSSGTRSTEAARSTIDRIETIKKAPDKTALYVNRLKELASQPRLAGSSTQLGLYRVVGEGEFELDCSIDEDNVLHVRATRGLS